MINNKNLEEDNQEDKIEKSNVIKSVFTSLTRIGKSTGKYEFNEKKKDPANEYYRATDKLEEQEIKKENTEKMENTKEIIKIAQEITNTIIDQAIMTHVMDRKKNQNQKKKKKGILSEGGNPTTKKRVRFKH